MMDKVSVSIEGTSIALDDFLKVAKCVDSGGMAKMIVRSGEVRVNGEIEQRRSRRLSLGDEVTWMQTVYRVEGKN